MQWQLAIVISATSRGHGERKPMVTLQRFRGVVSSSSSRSHLRSPPPLSHLTTTATRPHQGVSLTCSQNLCSHHNNRIPRSYDPPNPRIHHRNHLYLPTKGWRLATQKKHSALQPVIAEDRGSSRPETRIEQEANQKKHQASRDKLPQKKQVSYLDRIQGSMVSFCWLRVMVRGWRGEECEVSFC